MKKALEFDANLTVLFPAVKKRMSSKIKLQFEAGISSKDVHGNLPQH